MKLVLDTNVYSGYAEGLPDVVDMIATHGEYIFILSVVLCELTFRFMKGNKQPFYERKLRQFINRLKIEVINVDISVARGYGIIYLCRKKVKQYVLNKLLM